MKMYAVVLALVSLLAIKCEAQIYFPTTGSFYDVVVTKGTWTDARNLAESSFYLGTQGRLATITSQEENDFVLNNVIGTLGDTFWLGGYQPDGPNVAPDEGWEWITGELWEYTNWRRAGGDENEPNDYLVPGRKRMFFEVTRDDDGVERAVGSSLPAQAQPNQQNLPATTPPLLSDLA